MAISRMQMKRQLYNLGSPMPSINGREKFGLGSIIKKAVRKIIPNEVADIAVKAAPFVAPFNPAIAGAMAGLGSFDQTGSISRGVKAGLINYGLGNVARVLGGAGPQFGLKAPGTGTGIGSYFTSPTSGTQLFGAKPTDVTTEALPGPDLDTYAGIEEYQLSKTDPRLSQIKIGADKVIEDIYGTKATAPGYKDLFKQVISPDATLAERTTAIKDLGGKALKDIYTKPVTVDGKTEYKIDKLAVGATIAGAANYIEAKKLAEEADLVDDADEYTEEMYEADKARYKDYYSQILTPASFGLKDGGIISLRKMKQNGSVPEEFISYTDDNSGVIYYDPEGNPITKAEAMKAFDEMPEEDQILTDMEGKPLGESEVRKRILPKAKPKEFVFKGRLERLLEAKDMLQPESFEYLLNELKEEMTESGIPSIKLEKKAKGGIIGARGKYAMGSEVPIRQNEAGTKELDYRQSGGFVPPIGIKEKADDIPAMLSNNEFVFTADAVRAAGGGSVNKGAQKMYALMKQLENKVV